MVEKATIYDLDARQLRYIILNPSHFEIKGDKIFDPMYGYYVPKENASLIGQGYEDAV